MALVQGTGLAQIEGSMTFSQMKIPQSEEEGYISYLVDQVRSQYSLLEADQIVEEGLRSILKRKFVNYDCFWVAFRDEAGALSFFGLTKRRLEDGALDYQVKKFRATFRTDRDLQVTASQHWGSSGSRFLCFGSSDSYSYENYQTEFKKRGLNKRDFEIIQSYMQLQL